MTPKYYNIVFNLVVDEDQHKVEKLLNNLGPESPHIEEIIKIKTKTGNIKYLDSHVYVKFDENNEIISKTGVGGMATVYVARDKVLNRDVAVKVLKDEFTTDDEFVKRFNSEAQAAASLTHANIVSIYDVGNEDGIYYIVMELIQGKTLKQIISEDRSTSLEMVCKYCRTNCISLRNGSQKQHCS